MNNLYQVPNYVYNDIRSNRVNPYYVKNTNDERLAGGFVFPFLLGGVTGAAIAPAFYRPNYNRPVYYSPYPYQYPYYYQQRRWF